MSLLLLCLFPSLVTHGCPASVFPYLFMFTVIYPILLAYLLSGWMSFSLFVCWSVGLYLMAWSAYLVVCLSVCKFSPCICVCLLCPTPLSVSPRRDQYVLSCAFTCVWCRFMVSAFLAFSVGVVSFCLCFNLLPYGLRPVNDHRKNAESG